MRPEFIVCCRTSDPDPACVVEPDHAIAFCTRCCEPVRIGRQNVPYLFEGAAAICVQCVVEIPDVVFVRRCWW